MTIQPGEWQWFAFKYSFDSSRNSDDDKSNDQEPANLRLDAEPENGVSLILVNSEQIRDWQDGEKLEGFGAATPAHRPGGEQGQSRPLLPRPSRRSSLQRQRQHCR